MAHSSVPTMFRTAAGLAAARRRIFRLAAPVLRSSGYRGATLKHISRVVRLAPSSLYYYFPSKRALALFPLTDDNDVCPRLHASLGTAPPTRPLEQVRILVDYWTDELPDLLLAVDLAREVGSGRWAMKQMKQMHGYGLDLIAGVIRAVLPEFGDEEAKEVGRVLMAMLAGSQITDIDARPEQLRRHAVGILRRYLIAGGVEAADFDAAMAS